MKQFSQLPFLNNFQFKQSPTAVFLVAAWTVPDDSDNPTGDEVHYEVIDSTILVVPESHSVVDKVLIGVKGTVENKTLVLD